MNALLTLFGSLEWFKFNSNIQGDWKVSCTFFIILDIQNLFPSILPDEKDYTNNDSFKIFKGMEEGVTQHFKIALIVL